MRDRARGRVNADCDGIQINGWMDKWMDRWMDIGEYRSYFHQWSSQEELG